MDPLTMDRTVRGWWHRHVRRLLVAAMISASIAVSPVAAQPPPWMVPWRGWPPAGGLVQAPGGFNSGMRGRFQSGIGNPWAGNPINTANEGQVLVDLIHRHVTPSHWAAAGGPGTVYYWRPGRALVVRANDEAHQGISELLRQLRQAGE